QLSVDQLSAEQTPSMEEKEWVGPEALCPGWQEEEVSDGEGPEDSRHPDPTARAYEVLQRTLRLEGMPLTVDRTSQPRSGFGPLDMTVCVLGSPTAFLPILLEGGTCRPGTMVLCLAPAWATRVPSETSPGAWSLLLSRGVSFEAGGCTALEEFVPPRRATYVTGTFGSEGSWEAELARDLDCPTGGSAPLAHWLEDPLLSRWLLSARAGLPVPPTLAFITGPWEALPEEPTSPGMRLVRMQDPQGQESLVRDE
ncbi:CRNS1 synthase, partial [Odontophorus gujanensis]|nr:CRNS1 synthase [Odontophorus gujanensis]